jgi:DNA-binding transcriptional ArsR family regulator
LGATPKAQTAVAPDFVSPQLAAAMSHPTRVHTMVILRERTASPREVAKAIDERLNNVTYHINQLMKLGCVELVRTDRVRGGRVVEHFYRAKRRLYFDDDAWASLTEKERLGISGMTLRVISEDINEAMAAGTYFHDGGDGHASRSPMVLDEEGWEEVLDVLDRASLNLFEVEARVAERVMDGGEADIPAKVHILQFRSPPPPEEDD